MSCNCLDWLYCHNDASYQTNSDGTIRDYKTNDTLFRKERIKIFFKAYGMIIPDNLFIWGICWIEELCNLTNHEVLAGNKAFQKIMRLIIIKMKLLL